jgi:SAM-dependent methyltransferase/methyltransferase-like protein
MTSASQASYDELPYQSFPFAQTHPDRLATLGWLFGLKPTPIERCRVLEIGCASGGNLIPVAATLPHSEFVGIDFSAGEIDDGKADVAALGLANVRLVQMDISDFGVDFGTFDYIVAHGVYSWVSNDVQDKLLAICARQLSPNGIAYVSYNTLPGWRMRGAVREAMHYHTRQFSDAKTRVPQARAMLDFLARALQGNTSAYAVMLREEAEFVRKQPDFYIFHDYLEEVNEPLYFHQFIERAVRQGLRYLAEANFKSMLVGDLAPQVVQTLSQIAPDLLHREQFMDFLRNQTFRQTLLVREGVTLTRTLSPERVFGLRIASSARPVREAPDEGSPTPEDFRAPDGSRLTTQRPLTKAAMMVLAHNSPAAIAFDELCALASARLGARGALATDERDGLASDLLQCFAAGVVELHSAPSPFVIEAGARPEASALVRLQASRGAPVTNLRHKWVNLNEDVRRLLGILDGSRTQEEIAAIVWPGESTEAALAKLRPALSQIARQAFLVR